MCWAISILELNYRLNPSHMMCDQLTHAYPVTIMNKLFSSIPIRDFAIQDITLSFGHKEKIEEDGKRNSFILLVGRSASGKSTLLRMLSGDEIPASGKVFLNGSDLHNLGTPTCRASLPKPIFIDTKPDCYDNKFTVLERIQKAAKIDVEIFTSISQGLAEEFALILNLSHGQINGYPSELSPSGQYLFGVACACMESSSASLKDIDCDSTTIQLPYPVLLLDELLDKETSSVAHTVGKGLQNLSKNGAIVIAATHRPEYLKNTADRVITLSSGKILTNELCVK